MRYPSLSQRAESLPARSAPRPGEAQFDFCASKYCSHRGNHGSYVMASNHRAARALCFMQQCRQRASGPRRHELRISQYQARQFSGQSLDPESFGKKLRLDESETVEPIPEWRLPKADPAKALPARPAPRPSPYNFPRARDMDIPRYKHNPAVKPGMWSFIKHTIMRIPEPPDPRLASKPSFNVLTNPYRAKKPWPPILNQMPEIEQFHYEKKFRRRLLNKTKSMRTGWNRSTLFVQRAMITFILLWFLFASEPGNQDQRLPSDSFRYWFYGQLRKGNDTIWPQRLSKWIEEQYRYYLVRHKRQWDPYNHDGWDETRSRNSLPGMAGPPTQMPLEPPIKD